MQNPLFPIVILLCISMFFIKREYKVAILYFSLTVLFSVPNTYPGGKFLTLPMCFFLSEIPNYKSIFHHLIRSKLIIPISVMVLATFVLLFFSPHYHSFLGFCKIFYKEIICKHMYLIYGFICAVNYKSLMPFVKITYYSFLFITFLGVLNLITRHADFLDIAMQGGNWNDILEDMGGKYEFQTRFRVQATFFNAFCYGYICVTNLFFFIYAYGKKMINKKQFYISLACSLFGIIFCGCRTIFVVALASYFVYIMFSESVSKKIQYLIISFFIAFFSYEFIKPVEDIVDRTLTAFDSNYVMEGGGSSIDSRKIQYARVFWYIRNNMLFGRGLGFFKEDLGYKEGRAGMVDRDLHGLEGVLLSRLLERGIVGAIFYFLFFGIVLYLAYEYRGQDRKTTSFAISILTAYFLFANMTGELASFPPTFLFAGISIGIMYHNKKWHEFTYLARKHFKLLNK